MQEWKTPDKIVIAVQDKLLEGCRVKNIIEYIKSEFEFEIKKSIVYQIKSKLGIGTKNNQLAKLPDKITDAELLKRLDSKDRDVIELYTLAISTFLRDFHTYKEQTKVMICKLVQDDILKISDRLASKGQSIQDLIITIDSDSEEINIENDQS